MRTFIVQTISIDENDQSLCDWACQGYDLGCAFFPDESIKDDENGRPMRCASCLKAQIKYGNLEDGQHTLYDDDDPGEWEGCRGE